MSTIGVYQNPTIVGGAMIGEGTVIPGSAVFSDFDHKLTYTPSTLFDGDAQIVVRLTNGLKDTCGHALQTPPVGETLLAFQTQPPDTTAPADPVVNPVPPLTRNPSITVSGQAEASSQVTVSGGSAPVTTTASASGQFSVPVPLQANQSNSLQVQAEDASGNLSNGVAIDRDGEPLMVTQDSIPPALVSITPSDGATGVARDVVITASFDSQLDPASVNASNVTLNESAVSGALALTAGNTGFTFTPATPLDYNQTYTVRLRAGGIKDLAGNGLASQILASFSTEPLIVPPVITAVVPATAYQGQTVEIQIQGSGLDGASLEIEGTGVTIEALGGNDSVLNAQLVIDPQATPGQRTIRVSNSVGSASVEIEVATAPPPILTEVTPSGATPGSSVPVTLSGSALYSVFAVTSPNPGLTTSIVGKSADGSQLSLMVTVADDAQRGITSLIAQSGGGTASIRFVVDMPPTLTQIVPALGFLGQTLDLTISGTALSGAESIFSANPGISGTILTATDTAVTARLVIDQVAPVGATTVGVRTPIGESSIDFEVGIPGDFSRELRDAVSRAVSVYQGNETAAAVELTDAVSRTVSVYQGVFESGTDPASELTDAVSRTVSVYQGVLESGTDPAAELTDAVSRTVSVYQGVLESGTDPAAELHDAISRAVSVKNE